MKHRIQNFFYGPVMEWSIKYPDASRVAIVGIICLIILLPVVALVIIANVASNNAVSIGCLGLMVFWLYPWAKIIWIRRRELSETWGEWND
jgi:hypothetical protein